MGYEQYLTALAPPWLSDAGGSANVRAIGRLLDLGSSRVRLGTLARMPTSAAKLGISDALDETGEDRLMPRAPAESDATYAAALVDAFSTWRLAGTHAGLLIALQRAGFPVGSGGPTGHTTIVQYNGRAAQIDGSDNTIVYDLDADLTRPNMDDPTDLDGLPGWLFDAADTQWSSFGIIFPMAAPTINSITLANAAGNQTKALLNDTVEKWKPAKALYRGAWVLAGSTNHIWGWPPTSMDATMVYGNGARTWGGSTILHIDTGA